MLLTIEIPTDSQCFAHNFVLRLLGYSQFFSDKEEPSAFAHQHTDLIDSNIFQGVATSLKGFGYFLGPPNKNNNKLND